MSGTAAPLRLAAGCLAAIGLFAGPASAGDRTASSDDVKGVVELFTSQGCSSCLPADRVLTDLSRRSDLVTLAYHVDYWDYIGWRDLFGSPDNTKRQRDYARALNTGMIYTPQVIINGDRDVIGSRAAKIDAALSETALDKDDVEASVKLRLSGDRLHISATATWSDDKAMPVLMLVTFGGHEKTTVSRGENEGQTLVDTHPVRDWRIIGMVSGKPLEVDIPVATLVRAGEDPGGCAALLQTVRKGGTPGPILAATSIALDGQ